jgi:hypothetical protein
MQEVLRMHNTEDEKAIGYKSPPAWSRFRRGQSGNPSGRPKTAKTLKAELIEELEELTSISEGGQKLQITKARAIAKSIVRAATGGNVRATLALMSLFARDPLDTERPDETTPEERALLDDFVDREVRRRVAESSSNSLNEKENSHD